MYIYIFYIHTIYTYAILCYWLWCASISQIPGIVAWSLSCPNHPARLTQGIMFHVHRLPKNGVLSCLHKHMKVEMDHDTEITLQRAIIYCWWFRNPANHLRLVVYPLINKVLAPSQVVGRISWINRITYRLALLRTKSRLGMAGACGWWFAQGEPGAVCFVVGWCFFVEAI